MTKSDFIKELSNISGETQKTCKAVFDAIDTAVVNVIKAEDSVVIGNVKVSGVMKEAHVGRNPATGEAVNIPAKLRVVTKGMPSLKKIVNE